MTSIDWLVRQAYDAQGTGLGLAHLVFSGIPRVRALARSMHWTPTVMLHHGIDPRADSTAPVAIVPSSPGARRRLVEFEQLPRLSQDRFVASTTGTFPPWPILTAHPRPTDARGGTLLALAALVSMAALLGVGFGQVGSRAPLLPAWAPFVAACLVFAMVSALLAALATRGADDLPFRAGVYVFPSELIDARGPRLEVYPLSELTRIDTSAAEVQLRFRDGSEFTFAVEGDDAAASAVDQILRAARALAEAEDVDALRGLVDPLFAAEGQLPVDPGERLLLRRSFWSQHRLQLALAAAALVGPTAVRARDLASDRLAYDRACRDGTHAGLTAYAASGGRFADEVRTLRLPLLELRTHKGAAEIERWMAANPTTAATAEAREALRGALLGDLGRVTTLAGVRALAAAHPGLDPKALAAAEARLHRLAAMGGGVAATHLLHDPGACGTRLLVRIARGPAALAEVDHAVVRSLRFAGGASLPSRHLGAAPEREGVLRKALEGRVTAAYPEGCLTVGEGGPVLRLTWTPRWTGALRELALPSAVFADLGIDVDAELLSSEGRALASTHRSFKASVVDPWMPKLLVARSEPKDDAIERHAYAQLLDHGLAMAGEEIGVWLVGR